MVSPSETLSPPCPPTSQHVRALPLLENCTNSQESSRCEGGERVSLQEHEEENEAELIFLDVFHRVTFVCVFSGDIISFISFLQIPCEMYAERMPNTPMDGGREGRRDGWTQVDAQHILSSLFSCFSNFSIQRCMPHHLSLPSILTADEKVLFRTQGLYLVF